ncbi:MAG: GIY-YIG nuclease family protein, partial [Prochlorothrix sp.]
MTIDVPSLDTLIFVPYLDSQGLIPEQPFAGKVGVYAIFDADRTLVYVGLSRDIYASLKQHLVRCPDRCYWVKARTLDRPNRTILETMRQQWITENGTVPPGNGPEEEQWSQATDVKPLMTPEEKAAIEAADDLSRSKLLKDVARRVEAEIFATLEARGVTLKLRF